VTLQGAEGLECTPTPGQLDRERARERKRDGESKGERD